MTASREQEQRPLLRLARLSVRELKAIRALDLPEDGLGWGDEIPDVVLIGGPNGSGKTTLLEWIFAAMETLRDKSASPLVPSAGEIVVRLASNEIGPASVRMIYGPQGADGFSPASPGDIGVTYMDSTRLAGTGLRDFRQLVRNSARFAASSIPSLVYIPSSGRNLEVIHTEDKRPGRLPVHDRFLYRWEPARDEWSKSFEARLYSARWEDLNAKEEGRPDDARHFALYADAFASFFPGKRLTWRQAALVVEVVETGQTHGLEELSSGEKQILVFLAELLLRWRPGSMILIDEPELHLHPSLQVRFFDTLVQWREERGGQLILATQSNDLFRHAPSGTKLLLGKSL